MRKTPIVRRPAKSHSIRPVANDQRRVPNCGEGARLSVTIMAHVISDQSSHVDPICLFGSCSKQELRKHREFKSVPHAWETDTTWQSLNRSELGCLLPLAAHCIWCCSALRTFERIHHICFAKIVAHSETSQNKVFAQRRKKVSCTGIAC